MSQMGVLGSTQDDLPPPSSGFSQVHPLTIAGLAITVQGEALVAGTGVGAWRTDAHLLTVMVPCGTQV